MKNDDAMMGYFLLVKYSLFCLPNKYEKVDPELGFVAFLAVALLILYFYRRGEGGHNGRKSLILAPQEIPDISGYQWGFGCQCVKAYNNDIPVTNQKIL